MTSRQQSLPRVSWQSRYRLSLLDRLLEENPESSDGAVVLIARAFAFDPRDAALTIYEEVGPWIDVEDEELRSLLADFPEPPTDESRRRRLAAYLRRAIESPELSIEARAAAFTALPIASLEALSSLAVDAHPAFLERLSRPLGRYADDLVHKRRFFPQGHARIPGGRASLPPWFARLDVPERAAAVRRLADAREPEKLALAVTLGRVVRDRDPRALAEDERVSWLLRLIDLAEERTGEADDGRKTVDTTNRFRLLISRCVRTLADRDLAETRAALEGAQPWCRDEVSRVAADLLLPELLSGNDPQGAGPSEAREQVRLIEQWTEAARQRKRKEDP